MIRPHEEVLDLLKIPYDFSEVDKAYFPRKVKQYLNAAFARKEGMDLLRQKGLMYKNLILLSFWLDDIITDLDEDLSDANVELFYPKTKDMIVTRSLANDEKATFIEPFTAAESNRARQMMLGKGLKGRNIID